MSLAARCISGGLEYNAAGSQVRFDTDPRPAENSLRIHMEQFGEGGLSLAFEEPAERFPVLREMVLTGECEFLEPIRTRLRAVRIREMVEVDGLVQTAVRLSCGRCLAPFACPLSIEFALTYTGDRPGIQKAGEPEIREVDAAEIGLIYFHGEEIDLTEGIQEQVILAFPLRPLCRRDCKGLCARCGADLNQERCRCAPPADESPFAALSRLTLQPKPGGNHER